MAENPPASAGDGLHPGSERPPGEGNGEPTCQRRRWAPSLGQKDLLEKEMATHSSILAWEIPWTEEPGRTRLSD